MVKQSDIDLPVLFKNQPLFKAGKWNPKTNNNFEFTQDMVNNSVSNTKWSALNKRLYVKHEGADDVSKWKGKVENIRPEKGTVYGDVEIWDANEGLQILYGSKPVAISADIEYNDNGVMYFTGFAMENDPGVKDAKMFLSDSVKNELSGMYHAKFSAELDVTNIQKDNVNIVEPMRELAVKTDVQTNPIDNQSAERRFINDKQTDTMTENQNTVETQSSKSDVVNQLVNGLNNTQDPIRTEPIKQEIAKPEPVTTPAPKEQTSDNKENVVVPKQEGTVADKPLSTILPQDNMDEKLVNTIVDRLAEKLKPSLPQPITINEFGGYVDAEQDTVNRLAESLAKM